MEDVIADSCYRVLRPAIHTEPMIMLEHHRDELIFTMAAGAEPYFVIPPSRGVARFPPAEGINEFIYSDSHEGFHIEVNVSGYKGAVFIFHEVIPDFS